MNTKYLKFKTYTEMKFRPDGRTFDNTFVVKCQVLFIDRKAVTA